MDERESPSKTRKGSTRGGRLGLAGVNALGLLTRLLACISVVNAGWIAPHSMPHSSSRGSSLFPSTKLMAESNLSGKERVKRKIRLNSGESATILSRNIPIEEDWSITVWEWETPAVVIESYWEAQRQNAALIRDGRLLDPFGLVSWPGSVVAAQELKRCRKVIQNQTVLILGAGVGLEAQAAAMMGARHVLATDIHPTTLKQLAYGAEQANIKVETRVFDLFSQQPLPSSDVLIAADVLYNEQLASQVCRRCAEALASNPDIKILVTDSQRFVDFVTELNSQLCQVQKEAYHPVEWEERTLEQFTGSGVIIEDDQTYDVKVRAVWVGL